MFEGIAKPQMQDWTMTLSLPVQRQLQIYMELDTYHPAPSRLCLRQAQNTEGGFQYPPVAL